MMQISFGNVFSKSNLIKIYTSFLLSLPSSFSMEIVSVMPTSDRIPLFYSISYPYDTYHRQPTSSDGDLSFMKLSDEALWDEHVWFLDKLDYTLLSPFFDSIELGTDENGNPCSRAFNEYYVFHSREVTLGDFKLPCLTKLDQIDPSYKITSLREKHRETPTYFHDDIEYYYVHPDSFSGTADLDKTFFVWIESYNPNKTISSADEKLLNRTQTHSLESVNILLTKTEIDSLLLSKNTRAKRNLSININDLLKSNSDSSDNNTQRKEENAVPKTLRRTRTKSGTKDPSPRIFISSLTRSTDPSPLTSRKLDEPRDSCESPKRVQIKSSYPPDSLIDSDGTGSGGQISDSNSRRRRSGSTSTLRRSNHKLNSGSRGGSPRDESPRSLTSSMEYSPRSPSPRSASPRDDSLLTKSLSDSLGSHTSSSRDEIKYTLKVILTAGQVNTTTIDCSNMPSHYNMTIVPEIKETESKDSS